MHSGLNQNHHFSLVHNEKYSYLVFRRDVTPTRTLDETENRTIARNVNGSNGNPFLPKFPGHGVSQGGLPSGSVNFLSILNS